MEPSTTGNFSPVIECEQVLDFYHATGYLSAVAVAKHPKDLTQQKQWLDISCHTLKHDHGAATQLYQQMLELSQSQQHPRANASNECLMRH